VTGQRIAAEERLTYQTNFVYTNLITECPTNQLLVLVDWRYLVVPFKHHRTSLS
jgi:hypothetical protein